MTWSHLKAEEREVLSQMFAAGKSHAQIAKALGRHHSTIGRELKRNGYRGLYVAVDAQRCAEQRHAQARARCRKMQVPENGDYVKQALRHYWSPDQIAGRSKADFAQNSRRKLSHTTIYTWLKQDDHCRHWKSFLRCCKHAPRRTKSEQRQGRALEQRPAIINERGRYGDWEGDTIVGSGPHGGVFVSLVERRSRYTILLPLADRKSERVERAIRNRLQHLPKALRRSITFDNGSEFAAYQALENALQLAVYFTDPPRPGSVARTNTRTVWCVNSSRKGRTCAR